MAMQTFNGVVTESRQGHLLAMMLVAVILATFFITLRFLAVWKRGKGYGWDDYMMVISLVILCGLLGIGVEMINNGLGVHGSVLTVVQLENLLKGLLAFECIYVTTIACIKISLLLMYCRIFPTRSMKIWAWVLSSVAVAWAIAIAVLCIFQCTPIEKAWNPFVPGHCINLRGSFIGNAVPNIITDVIILTLPVNYVWKLRTNLSQRISLTCIFLLGSFVVFTSAFRFATLFEFNPMDTSWTLGTACAWCVLETSAGIISACLPTLGPLLQLLKASLGIQSRLSKTAPSPMLPTDFITIGGHNGRGQLVKNKKSLESDDIGATLSTVASIRPSKAALNKPQARAYAKYNRSSDAIPLCEIRQHVSIDSHSEHIDYDPETDPKQDTKQGYKEAWITPVTNLE